jgi:hypothetical protein
MDTKYCINNPLIVRILLKFQAGRPGCTDRIIMRILKEWAKTKADAQPLQGRDKSKKLTISG